MGGIRLAFFFACLLVCLLSSLLSGRAMGNRQQALCTREMKFHSRRAPTALGTLGTLGAGYRSTIHHARKNCSFGVMRYWAPAASGNAMRYTSTHPDRQGTDADSCSVKRRRRATLGIERRATLSDEKRGKIEAFENKNVRQEASETSSMHLGLSTIFVMPETARECKLGFISRRRFCLRIDTFKINIRRKAQYIG